MASANVNAASAAIPLRMMAPSRIGPALQFEPDGSPKLAIGSHLELSRHVLARLALLFGHGVRYDPHDGGGWTAGRERFSEQEVVAVLCSLDGLPYRQPSGGRGRVKLGAGVVDSVVALARLLASGGAL
jgi:hypothetical protein